MNTGSAFAAVRLRDFAWDELLTEKSPLMQAILAGIMEGKPFVFEDEEWAADHER